MPKEYEAMRDEFIREGMSPKEAKTKAAKIYNSKHPGRPVSKSHREGAKRKARKR